MGTIVHHGHQTVYPVHDAATTAGHGLLLLIPLGIIFASFAVGLWVFNREAPRIAEEL